MRKARVLTSAFVLFSLLVGCTAGNDNAQEAPGISEDSSTQSPPSDPEEKEALQAWMHKPQS